MLNSLFGPRKIPQNVFSSHAHQDQKQGGQDARPVFAHVTVDDHRQIVRLVDDFQRRHDGVGTALQIANVEAPLSFAIVVIDEMARQKPEFEESRQVREG